MPVSFDFARETAVRRRADGAFEATLDPSWLVQKGPNGGYLAAIVLRAFVALVDEPARLPRSLTVHYCAPADDRPLVVHAAVERVGRSLTTCSARLVQGDTLVGLALGACSKPRPGPEFCDLVMPEVADPTTMPASVPPPDAPPIARRWETRWAIGTLPFTGAVSREAVAGGWIRLPERQVADASVIAAITDAWIPPAFARVRESFVVPTVDLTVHFRTVLPHTTMSADDACLAVFRTRAAAGGFLEEDGEVWSPDGVLLAQSRQLAAIVTVPTP
ncbi:MAG: thioesterase family protein [Acidimicrobiia bacterium]